MKVDLLVQDAQVIDGTGAAPFTADVGIRGEHICFVGPGGELKARRMIDASGRCVCPGFIDLQINGGFGHDFTANPEKIWEVGGQLARYGVTSFLPTIITSPLETIAQAQAAVSRACTILSKKSIRAGGVVSAVDVNKCSGCGVCEAVCAFGAVNLEYNERIGRNVAVVTQASCKGCGVCSSTCRSSAIDLKGFSDSEILEMVDAL